MLTITFIADELKTVVSCEIYTVTSTASGSNIRVWSSLKGESFEDFLIEPDSDDAFPVAYVTNLAGKTIDRIGG